MKMARAEIWHRGAPAGSHSRVARRHSESQIPVQHHQHHVAGLTAGHPQIKRHGGGAAPLDMMCCMPALGLLQQAASSPTSIKASESSRISALSASQQRRQLQQRPLRLCRLRHSSSSIAAGTAEAKARLSAPGPATSSAPPAAALEAFTAVRWRCPTCGLPLLPAATAAAKSNAAADACAGAAAAASTGGPANLCCAAGHTIAIAKQGHVNLLPAGRLQPKSAAASGYDEAMVSIAAADRNMLPNKTRRAALAAQCSRLCAGRSLFSRFFFSCEAGGSNCQRRRCVSLRKHDKEFRRDSCWLSCRCVRGGHSLTVAAIARWRMQSPTRLLRGLRTAI